MKQVFSCIQFRTHTVLCLLLYSHYYHLLNVLSPTKQICSNISSARVSTSPCYIYIYFLVLSSRGKSKVIKNSKWDTWLQIKVTNPVVKFIAWFSRSSSYYKTSVFLPGILYCTFFFPLPPFIKVIFMDMCIYIYLHMQNMCVDYGGRCWCHRGTTSGVNGEWW